MQRKETSKNALAARARMLRTANLGWLEGFPLPAPDGGVRWIMVPAHAPVQEIRLEGRHLGRGCPQRFALLHRSDSLRQGAADAQRVCEVVLEVLAGRFYVCAEITRAAVQAARSQESPQPRAAGTLTRRELEGPGGAGALRLASRRGAVIGAEQRGLG
jgi:hypothetical protein